MARMRACGVDELADGHGIRLDTDPDIAVFRVEGNFYATADSCTHEQWSLGEDGEIDAHEVECSLHGARFDVRSGKVTEMPATEDLRTYPVEVADGAVWVHVAD